MSNLFKRLDGFFRKGLWNEINPDLLIGYFRSVASYYIEMSRNALYFIHKT